MVVWDDQILAKDLSTVKGFYIRARKQNCSVVFLSQSYYDIPTIIRKNANYLVLLNLGGSKREQTAILNEWSSDLDKEQLKYIYNDAVSVPMRPLIITGGKCDRNKKYRKGWDDFYNLDKFFKDMPKEEKKERKNKAKYMDTDETDYDS